MTLNEMKLGRPSTSALFPPTIEGFSAVDEGLRISPNSLKIWWPGTELNHLPLIVFCKLLENTFGRFGKCRRFAILVSVLCPWDLGRVHHQFPSSIARMCPAIFPVLASSFCKSFSSSCCPWVADNRHCRPPIFCFQVWLVGPQEEQCLQGPVSCWRNIPITLKKTQ